MSMWGAEGPTLGDLIIQQSQPTPPAPVEPPPAPVIPTDAAGAVARLNELRESPEWREKWLAGNPREGREYKDLQAIIEKGENAAVDKAMAGIMDDAPFQQSGHLEMVAATQMFRELGIRDEVIREFLTDRPVTRKEHDLVAQWRAEKLRDSEWVKKYMAGEGLQRREMMIASGILSTSIRQEEK